MPYRWNSKQRLPCQPQKVKTKGCFGSVSIRWARLSWRPGHVSAQQQHSSRGGNPAVGARRTTRGEGPSRNCPEHRTSVSSSHTSSSYLVLVVFAQKLPAPWKNLGSGHNEVKGHGVWLNTNHSFCGISAQRVLQSVCESIEMETLREEIQIEIKTHLLCLYFTYQIDRDLKV